MRFPLYAALALGWVSAALACGGGGGGTTVPTPVTSVTIMSITAPASGQVGTAYTVTVTAVAANTDGALPVDSIVVSDADERRVALSGTFSQNFILGAITGTEQVHITAYSHDVSAGPVRSASSTRNVTRTPAPVPPVASPVSIGFAEADSAGSDLSGATTGASNRTYALLNVPAQLIASLTGSTLHVRGADGDINGGWSFKYVVTDSVGADTADVNVAISPMTDFAYELREARSDTLITTAAQLTIDGATYSAVNGVFSGQLSPGAHTITLVANAETFKSDRVQHPDGSLQGVNWPGNASFTTSFGSDFDSAGTIIRLAKDGSPYGPLAEVMRLYNLVWTWFGTEQRVPVFDTVTIALYVGPADTLWGFTRGATASELQAMTEGALDARVQFAYGEYTILIDTIGALPSQWPGDMPGGLQVVGIGVTDGNFTIDDPGSGRWIGSRVRVGVGFSRGLVRSELYNFHAGQQGEDTANLGATFFCSNACFGYSDLSPGDIDMVRNVNRLFVRDAERKRLANGLAGFRLVE